MAKSLLALALLGAVFVTCEVPLEEVCNASEVDVPQCRVTHEASR